MTGCSSGNSLSEEWHQLDSEFHKAYLGALDSAFLTADAHLALEKVAAGGHTQSLLSMFPHEFLIPLVDRLEIGAYFDRIDGLQGDGASPGDLKSAYLVRHLAVLTRGDAPAPWRSSATPPTTRLRRWPSAPESFSTTAARIIAPTSTKLESQ